MCQDFSNDQSLPRGIRNNNPGNIRSGSAWQGATGADSAGFVIFKDSCWGIRALATDLTNKIKRGLTTIRQIITVYAPPSENNTAAYVAAVSGSTGLGADDPLTGDQQTIHDLIRAIMDHENGDSSMISDADIDQGISLMGIQLAQLPADAAAAIADNPSSSILVIGGVVVLLALLSKKKF
jgi:hypothetical protein